MKKNEKIIVTLLELHAIVEFTTPVKDSNTVM